jgi:hypothetical protein
MKPGKHLIEDDGVTHSPNCFPCRIKSVSVAPSAMGTRFPTAARAFETEPQLHKDRDAYKRMRRDGEQPKHINGSAQLEAKANESFEITWGRTVRDTQDRKEMAAAFAGMPAPATSPIVREGQEPPKAPRPTGVKRV